MFPGGPGDRASMVTASSLPTARLRPAGCPPPSLSPCAVLCTAGTVPTARLRPQQQDGPICAPTVPYSPTTSSVATVTPRCSPTPRYPPHHTPFPHIPHSIPVLTLSPSGAHLEGLPGEVPGTELALDAAFGAAVLQVLGQIAAAQFGAAAVGAGDDVEAAGAQVGLGEGGAQGWSGLGYGVMMWGAPCPLSYLQVPDEPAPAAALLAVDAADGQTQHLRFQLGVGVDLEVGGAGGAASCGHSAQGRTPPSQHTNKRPLSERVSASHHRGTKGC